MKICEQYIPLSRFGPQNIIFHCIAESCITPKSWLSIKLFNDGWSEHLAATTSSHNEDTPFKTTIKDGTTVIGPEITSLACKLVVPHFSCITAEDGQANNEKCMYDVP
jgi:hypothetical protein